MACGTISTGSGFLSGTSAFIDCQAQTIGSYGYGALADPGSPVFAALSGLLTIFIALYGLKLLLGQSITLPGIVGAALKVGIVLTLATSWPAWRVVGFNLIMHAPFEIAQTIGLSTGVVTEPAEAVSRLQSIDDNIVVITEYGTGRLTGGVAAGHELGDSFAGIALADQSALGFGRAAFLVGTLVPFGIFRLGAGLLLALAPLVAGLLLFDGTIAIFMGWVRGLLFCAIGTLTLLLIQGVEIALFEPWLQSVIAERQQGALTPSAPTELLVLSVVFSGVNLGLMLLILRLTFYPPQVHFPLISSSERRTGGVTRMAMSVDAVALTSQSRARLIADQVSGSMRREHIHSTSLALSGNSGMPQPRQTRGGFTSLAGPQGPANAPTMSRAMPVRTSRSARVRDTRS